MRGEIRIWFGTQQRVTLKRKALYELIDICMADNLRLFPADLSDDAALYA